jgi:RHS repeat-associated protein
MRRENVMHSRLSRWLAAGTSAVLLAALIHGQPAAAVPATAVPATPEQINPVPVTAVAVKAAPSSQSSAEALREAPRVAWPTAGSAEVAVAASGAATAASGAATAVKVGGLPVRVGAATASRKASAKPQTSPVATPVGSVRVEVQDRAAAAAAGVAGLLLRLRRADGQKDAGAVSVSLDYSAFRNAYGGDWGSRLRLVRLPDAVLPSDNDPVSGTVTAQVEVSGVDTTVALVAGASGANGDFKATSLALSSSWQVSAQTGEFTWSYPLRMPDTPGGLAPQLAISYNSGSVDGRTAATNNQPSWVGEGFDLWSGYLTRSYRGCGDDLGGNNGQTKTGDQCWFSDNATVSLAGHSGELVRDGGTGVWRLKSDDGSRIERCTRANVCGGASGVPTNGYDGEYWKLTSRDGTRYYFGLNRLPNWTAGKAETQSTLTAPVFGNHSQEPCFNAAGYASSWCQQAYRWNLDYVVDAHGNSIAYYYAKSFNSYGLNMGKQTVRYDRDGVLLRAEFGTRTGGEYAAPAPASVVFNTDARCIAGTACAQLTPANYPDTPLDQGCAANCTTLVSPTFWVDRRLTSVTTKIGDKPIETWTLSHSFPATGDPDNSPALWLNSITHSGGSDSEPPTTFGGERKQNRLNTDTDGLSGLNKYRLTSITNEHGGVVGVNYAPPNCAVGSLPVPERNTLRCFPVPWQPEGGIERTDWMHKYVVDSVSQVDLVGGSPTETTAYQYIGDGAWHYNDNELLKADKRSWSEWRGYERVAVLHGDPNGTRSKTEYLYFRGMNGDRLSSGTRAVKVKDSQNVEVNDDEQLNGRIREKLSYDGANGSLIGGTITDPWQRGPTATQGAAKAYMVDTETVRDRVAISGGRWRLTEIKRTYNDDGLVSQIDDRGDVAVTGDEQCTRTWYARNESAWLVSLPARVETVAVGCAATPIYPRDALTDMRTFYDGSTTNGAAPSAGNPTRVEQVADYPDGKPRYVVATHSTFDDYGRPLETFDALDRPTVTAYTDVAGLTTQVTVTNAARHVTTTELDPAWGEPVAAIDPNGRRTDSRYDGLGRLTAVWLPGRSAAGGQSPHMRYRYTLRGVTGPTVVATESLRANGNIITAYSLYDGFLRPRQNQSPAWGGGRVLSDTVFDARGMAVKSNAGYYAEGAPGTTLVAAGDNNIPSQTVTTYDGAGRATRSTLLSLGVEQWHASTDYQGDRTNTTPPPGGTATSVEIDGRGRTVALRQYRDGKPTGADANADVTRYSYTPAGQLKTVTDPAGNRWSYGYDTMGRRTSVDDPDAGHSTSSFDDAGQLLSATNARGEVVKYSYDSLGRKTEERNGVDNSLRAKWTYDVLADGTKVLGQPVSSTRYEGGNEYTTAVLGYDTGYQPTASTVTIPAAEGALAGTYRTDFTYRPDGSPNAVTLPAVGDLKAETITFAYDDYGLPKRTTGAVPFGSETTYVDDTIYTRLNETSQLRLGAAGKRVYNTIYRDQPSRRTLRSLVERETATGSTVNDLRYTYDPAGNLTAVSDVPEGGPADRQCFAYDYLRRMTEAWTVTGECPTAPSASAVGGTAAYWTSYRYDVTGNRTSEVQHSTTGAGDTTRTYTYPQAGQAHPHAVSSVTTTGPSGSSMDSYRYSETGNTTERNLAGNTQKLGWDISGRLASAQAADGKNTTFTYTADGARLLRRDPAATTLYLGNQEIKLANGVKTATRYYSHGGTTVAVRTNDGALSWQFTDHHGTATTSINADDLTVTRRLFTPFGDRRGAAPASWPNEHAFVGGISDDSLGLVSLGAREYDPATGRFISVDPVIDPNDPQQLNGYAYANNNPASMSDPDGMMYWADMDGMVSLPSKKAATPKMIARAEKKLKHFAKVNQAVKKRQQAVARASGHSQKEIEEAKEIKDKSLLDVVIEAGGELIKELLGINDIQGCFGNGDIGACISMAVNFIPWSKLLKIGEYIGAVKRAFKAVLNFRKMEKHADDVLEDLAAAAKKADSEKIEVADDALEPVAATSCKLHSFRPDTRVRLANGTTKRIRDIKLGDKVLATDEKPGTLKARTVVALHINTDHELVDLGVRDPRTGHTDVIHTTKHHPFWVTNRHGWSTATDLHPGEQLSSADGRPVVVATVQRYTGAQVMRDLTIDQLHTYYVVAGTTPVLVHNCGNRPPNLSPEGAGRRGAFNQAKRDSGIPTSQSPDRTLPNVDRRGNPQPGRIYEFDVPAEGGGARTVRIRDDAGGHEFPDDPSQNRGPHFNTENGDHYDY